MDKKHITKLISIADDLAKRGELNLANNIGAIVSMAAMDEFTQAYLEAALWSSTDDEGKPLDKNHSMQDFAPETLEKMKADAAKFQQENSEDIAGAAKQAGHDFWLTRSGHGAGYWDGDWEEEVGKRLTTAAKKFGEFDLYVGDDGLIHH